MNSQSIFLMHKKSSLHKHVKLCYCMASYGTVFDGTLSYPETQDDERLSFRIFFLKNFGKLVIYATEMGSIEKYDTGKVDLR